MARTSRCVLCCLTSIRRPQRYAFVQPKATPPIRGSIASLATPDPHVRFTAYPFLGRLNTKVTQPRDTSRNTYRLVTHRLPQPIRPQQQPEAAPRKAIASTPTPYFIVHTFTPLPRGTQRKIGPSNSRRIERSRIERHDPEKPDAGPPGCATSTPPVQRRIGSIQACSVRLAW